MDGGSIAAVIISSLAVGGAIGGGFWKLGRSIGRLEGTVGGLNERMQGYENSLGRIEKRINGLFGHSSDEEESP